MVVETIDAVTPVTVDSPFLIRVATFAALSAAVTGLAATIYRWYARDEIPEGIAVLLGIGAVAIYLNTTAILGATVAGTVDPFAIDTVIANLVSFAVAGLAAPIGRRAGDYTTREFLTLPDFAGDRDIGEVVRSAGRTIAVTLPDEIDDMPDHDPVPAETKAELAGRTLVFPRRLTVAELRDRLVARLRDDFQVGHVDVDLTAAGTVEYLALGSRAAGLGPTLPPGTAAVAVRADPAFTSGPGDAVQIWRSKVPVDARPDHAAVEGTRTGAGATETEAGVGRPVPESASRYERVATAEVRAVAGDTVTLAVDAADVARLQDERYRLVTLPTEPKPEREFARLLRRAEETLGVVTVEAGADLEGLIVGAIDATVVAVRPTSASIVTLPQGDRTIGAGDRLYVVGRPDAIRKIERAATVGEQA